MFLLAGEPSGDKLGAALMAGLRELDRSFAFEGVGGAEMTARGLQSLFPMSDLSVMGLAEVLPRYPLLRRRLGETVAAVARFAPDVLITIDSPDFCLRVVKHVRKRGQALRCVHYVAPSVWAWRPKRAEKLAKLVDQVLALLPFEPPYFERVGLRCDFVGHPVAAEPVATETEAHAFRTAHGISETCPIVLALPGSRAGEVSRLSAIFGDVLRMALPDGARVVVPTVATLADRVREAIADWPGAPILLDPRRCGAAAAQKNAAFRAADAALAASGTVSLELAAAGTPMVIAYDTSWLTRQIAKRMVKIDTVTLVNLVSETRAVPEFLTDRCRADLIAPAVREVLRTGAPEQAAVMRRTMERLGQGGEAPGLRAARAVLDGLRPL